MITHTMRLTRQKGIFIATAHGLIKLTRSTKRDEFRIELPADLQFASTEERAFASAVHIAQSPTGKVIPKYDLLVPKLDASGELCKLEPKQVARMMSSATIHPLQTI